MSTVAEMKAFRADLRQRVAAAGRDPESCKLFFVARRRWARPTPRPRSACRRRQAQREASPEMTLAQMASLTDIDFAAFDLDAPIGELSTNGQQGTLKRFLAQGSTLREIARNYRYGFEDARRNTRACRRRHGRGHGGGRRRRLHVQRARDAPLRRRDHRRRSCRPCSAWGWSAPPTSIAHFRDNLLAF